MPVSTSPLVRFFYSLSSRLQVITLILSLVGIGFGIRDYIHISEQFGAEKSASFLDDLYTQIGVAILLNVISAIVIYAIATKPLRVLSEVMRNLSRGVLDIDVPYADEGNEIGSMARKVVVFKQNAIDKRKLEEQQKSQAAQEEQAKKKRMMETLAADLESAVLSAVNVVASAAGDMKTDAQNLTKIADKTSEQCASVAAATEETSVSVQTVAAAVEELSTSIGAINQRVTESARISAEAVTEVRKADATIAGLSDAAAQIGDVVKLIQDIAGQTNLLALNATIEAARAGEAGKGFAVVANEVKNLANQTASATEEISKKIQTIQNVSMESVDAIRGVGKTIDQTNEIATNISRATQQQTISAQEISRNVQQASDGTSKIAANIMAVTKDATEARHASEGVLETSGKLLGQSERLKEEIRSFLKKIRQG